MLLQLALQQQHCRAAAAALVVTGDLTPEGLYVLLHSILQRQQQ
jgi:hypothetical protein